MDTETLKTLYGSCKAYTMLLTDLLDENVQNFQYDINKEELKIAKFGMISNIFLAIKEKIVSGTRDNYETEIFYEKLVQSVNYIANKKDDGYYIDNHKFKDAESVVGELRNKMAHGSYTLDSEKGNVIFKIEKDDVTISIDKLSCMVISCFKSFLNSPRRDTYKKEYLFSDKCEKNREKPFKNKDELLAFSTTFKVKTITLKRKDGSQIEAEAASLFENVYELYKVGYSVTIINALKKVLEDNYTISVTEEEVSRKILNQAVDEAYNNLTDGMTYDNQVRFLSLIIEAKRNSSFSLIISSLKNLVLASELEKNNIKGKDEVIKHLKESHVIDTLGYNELVAMGISLFQSLFSYGNDMIFKNDNEYAAGENTGLNYGNLNLSCINVLYFEPDENIKNEVITQLTSKNKQIMDYENKIEKLENNLKNVKDKGNIAAVSKINDSISKYETQRQVLETEKSQLDVRLNEILSYEAKNSEHIKNKTIINGIRNSIAHGNYTLKSSENEGIIIIFEDIYEGKLTFKCEIDIIDFINMIYGNQSVIIDFLNKNEQKLVRTKKSQSI